MYVCMCTHVFVCVDEQEMCVCVCKSTCVLTEPSTPQMRDLRANEI
jgi:hypothetical protein